MIEETSGILVGEQEAVTLVRVEGRGTHQNSHFLKQYLLQCLQENRHLFQIDLSHCTYMDSTFLGMLAGIGSKVKTSSLPPIKLLNTTERVLGMIQGLGIDHLFQMVHEGRIETPLNKLQGEEISKEAKSREMLEAHEKLVSISKTNESKFRDVIELLRHKINKTSSL